MNYIGQGGDAECVCFKKTKGMFIKKVRRGSAEAMQL